MSTFAHNFSPLEPLSISGVDAVNNPFSTISREIKPVALVGIGIVDPTLQQQSLMRRPE